MLEEDFPDRLPVGEHQDRDGRGAQGLDGRARHLEARLAERRGLRGRPVPDGDREARRGEAKGHRGPEETGAENGDVAHAAILRPAPGIGHGDTRGGAAARPRTRPGAAAGDNRLQVSRRFLAVSFVLLGAAGASCGRASVPAFGPARLAIRTPILSLDPTFSEATTISVLSNVFEPLVAHDRQLQVVPALATRWSTPDETTWVFTLRPGVLFHDGTPLDSAAVVAALDRARNGPDSAVRGALWAVAKVEAAGALAVRIRTAVPDALLLHELALVLVARGASRTEVEAKPVGTGPYRVVSWDRRGALELAAWEKHWAGPPAIASVLVAPLAEGVDAAGAAGRGEVDVVEVPISTARGTAPAGARFVTSSGLTTQYLWMNGPAVAAGVPNPFFDVRVRRAVALAVDQSPARPRGDGERGDGRPADRPPDGRRARRRPPGARVRPGRGARPPRRRRLPGSPRRIAHLPLRPHRRRRRAPPPGDARSRRIPRDAPAGARERPLRRDARGTLRARPGRLDLRRPRHRRLLQGLRPEPPRGRDGRRLQPGLRQPGGRPPRGREPLDPRELLAPRAPREGDPARDGRGPARAPLPPARRLGPLLPARVDAAPGPEPRRCRDAIRGGGR